MVKLTLDDIIDGWKEDAVIDEKNLDSASIHNARLHAKYLDFYTKLRLIVRKKEKELELLKKDMFLYYSGKMTKAEMDERGWLYDPFNGASKPLKSDLGMFITSDERVAKLLDSIEYSKTLKDAVGMILDQIKWRHQTIKNIIDHRKFIAGC